MSYLELIIGPMYAGKSTELIRIINRYKCLNKNIIIINHVLNNRYGTTGLSTHNNEKIDHCIIIEKLADLDNEIFEKSEVIIIEELQFFEDAFEMVTKWCTNYGKTVIAAGLDGDFKCEKFGGILDLIPMCDSVKKLASFCNLCKDGTPGIFSLRLTHEKEQMLIGSDNYIPVCRSCYEC